MDTAPQVEVKTLNVYQRINEVKKLVGYVRKDKKVEGQGYMAVTHDAVTALTRQHFIDCGVVIVPVELSSATVDSGTVTGKGNPIIRFEAKYRVHFVNADDPKDELSVEFTAHALDQGDKAPGKAHSYATKYAVLKVLQLETGEEEEGREPAKPKKHADIPLPMGTITPSTGVWESLDADMQTYLTDIANEVHDLMRKNDVAGALQRIADAKLDADEKVAINTRFDSKERTAMKKELAAQREMATQA